jgi:hypothetical protein
LALLGTGTEDTGIITGIVPTREWDFALDWKNKLAVARTPKVRVVDKFGYNGAVGTSAEEDIWSVGGEETLLTSGATMYASCTDNTNGVGQVIRVFGLNEKWEQVYGQVTLTGQTQAEVKDMTGTAMTFTRIHRAYQTSGGADPVGDVYIAESDDLTAGVPDTATKIHGFIDYTNAAQQTQKAVYTIPRGHVGIVTETHGYLVTPTGTARSCRIGLETASLATGATYDSPSWQPRRAREQYVVGTAGSAQWDHRFRSGVYCPPLTNVAVRGIATGSECAIYASFSVTVIPVDSSSTYATDVP